MALTFLSVRKNRFKCYTDENEMYNDIKELDKKVYTEPTVSGNASVGLELDYTEHIASSQTLSLVSAKSNPWPDELAPPNNAWYDWHPDVTDEKALKTVREFTDDAYIKLYSNPDGKAARRAKKIHIEIEKWLAGWETWRVWQHNGDYYIGKPAYGLGQYIQSSDKENFDWSNYTRMHQDVPKYMFLLEDDVLDDLYTRIKNQFSTHSNIAESRLYNFMTIFCSAYESVL